MTLNESLLQPNLNGLLFEAAEDANLGLVKLLIRAGADVKSKNTYGYTPLHYAVGTDQLGVVELLVKHGADVNANDNREGMTPLHLAIHTGYADDNLAVIKFLLSKKASTKIKNRQGFTTECEIAMIRNRDIDNRIKRFVK